MSMTAKGSQYICWPIPLYVEEANDSHLNDSLQEQTPLMLNSCQQAPLFVKSRNSLTAAGTRSSAMGSRSSVVGTRSSCSRLASPYSPLNETPADQEDLTINVCQETPFVVQSRTVTGKGSKAGLAILRAEICELEVKEMEVAALLDDMGKSFAKKRAPLENEKKRIAEEKQRLNLKLLTWTAPASLYPPAPGPRELNFVESDRFAIICNTIVVLNLVCMAFSEKLQNYHSILYILDQLFLVWYVFELTVKWKYHRCNLFRGAASVVWWNWLDAGIVIGGVIDQWVMAVVKGLNKVQLPANCAGMRVLRLLRLFRIMRFLKVVKAFVMGDMSWTEREPFQIFMSAVIAVNSVVLALELDIDWTGWIWIEQIFLLIYLFELGVRLKLFGWRFFVNADFAWNNLDFVMVCGSIFNLWLMPGWSIIEAEMYGEMPKHNTSYHRILKMLKMLKIIRVLRLVRLLRMVKPLYTLLVGVMDALAAMQWVMVLTLLVLYAGAIVFTSLIGHGFIYENAEDIPPEAGKNFGNVPASIFALFKLMNGDTAVVDPITKNPGGQLLFAAFMVLSNWAVLAILTSVVSDNMMKSSQKVVEEDKKKEEDERLEIRTKRLLRLFAQIDTNDSGSLSRSEWEAMLVDPDIKWELGEASGLDENTLRDVFVCLADENDDVGESLHCEDFIAHLNHDKDVADRRQVLHLSHLMKELQNVTLRKIAQLEEMAEKRFRVLEGKLEKVMLPMDQKSRPEHAYDQNEVEAATISRIGELEAVTEQKFEVLEGVSQQNFEVLQGMLKKVLSAVNQNSHQEDRPRHSL